MNLESIRRNIARRQASAPEPTVADTGGDRGWPASERQLDYLARLFLATSIVEIAGVRAQDIEALSSDQASKAIEALRPFVEL